MIVLDVNVVLAAYRADHVHHEAVRPWLERQLSEGEHIVVPDLVWVGFLRLVTNPRIFTAPSGVEQAFEFVEALTAQPAYVAFPGLPQGLSRLRRLSIDSDARGNLIPDAYVAAVADSLACAVATLDRDFRRFDGLRLVTPGA